MCHSGVCGGVRVSQWCVCVRGGGVECVTVVCVSGKGECVRHSDVSVRGEGACVTVACEFGQKVRV